MIQLTAQDREDLKLLKNHPWFRVLEKIEVDASISLGNALQTMDLENVENIAIIKKNQLYSKARKDFLWNIDAHLSEISEVNV